MNVYSEIARRLSESPEEVSLVDFRSGRELTAGELLASADQIAVSLSSLLPAKKSVVALCLPNGPECVASVLALWKLGHAVMPLPHTFTEGEIKRIMGNGPAAVLLSASRLERFRPDPTPEFPLEDLAFVRFTSGTTEDARGVLISHPAIMARASSFGRALGLQPGHAVLWHLDMSYHFTTSITAFLLNRCEIHLGSLLMPARFVEWIGKRRVDYFFSLPFFFEQWATATNAIPRNEIKFFVTGQAVDAAVLEKFKSRHGTPPRRMYGVIEAGIPALHADCADPRVIGKLAEDFSVKFDDDGIIHVKSPGPFSGYLMGDDFKYAPRTDEWFNTGDRGEWNEKGELVIVGRAKEMIVLPGVKFFPSEVERALNAAPGVNLSAVFVSSAGLTAVYEGSADARAVEAHARAHLERAKVPEKFVRLEKLPRTASGKIHRQAQAYAEFL